MAALVSSIVLGVVVLGVPFGYFYKKRPVGAPLSWGQAMVASTWAFFLMFWFYGVVPHQWLLLADNEWAWRPDRAWNGPADILTKLPFEMNYLIARDLIAVGIYLVIIGANVALFSKWQARGKDKPSTDVVRSSYGRPLVKG